MRGLVCSAVTLTVPLSVSACAIDTVDDVGESESALSAYDHGRQVWFDNTYGGEKFFAFLPSHPDPTKRIEIGFRNVVETPRAQRFALWGVINDPDCVADPDGGPDLCPNPTATGVVGMRKFPGPNGTTMYGASCASCHAGFDPNNPPDDPAEPQWDNIHPTIGNQYLKFGAIFSANLAPTDPRRLLFAAWPDGAVDTQLLFSDNIHNPGVVTAFWEWDDRPRFDVGMDEPQLRNGQGGEDDVGPGLAAVRVYTNIGVCFFECTLPAIATNQPINIDQCRNTCPDFPPQQDLDDLGSFLGTFEAPKFPGRPALPFVAAWGEHVFNRNCRSCHDDSGHQKRVMSNDEVNPLVADPANATNACRAKTTMWETGKLWANFSSQVYKDRVAAGNRGYRTMPLGGIWATAPFLHNQSIGGWAPASADPEERAVYYWDAMWELLKPSRTPVINRIPVALGPFPAGYPTTLVFSRDPTTGEVLCDDVVENRGHYYGSGLDDFSKVALIYWLQYR